ncbi:MAG: hypothetical protein LQ338_007620 [Usnochroma carphineum]|nr:MAG: hypothetical protein LQ338_007620 [Usnochroma carphineum]
MVKNRKFNKTTMHDILRYMAANANDFGRSPFVVRQQVSVSDVESGFERLSISANVSSSNLTAPEHKAEDVNLSKAEQAKRDYEAAEKLMEETLDGIKAEHDRVFLELYDIAESEEKKQAAEGRAVDHDEIFKECVTETGRREKEYDEMKRGLEDQINDLRSEWAHQEALEAVAKEE